MRKVIPETDINRIDLNLLKSFAALLETGNVTLAGEKLGVTQSSMSHSLRRLREIFQDELFVRSTHGMVPTMLAAQLAEPLILALSSIQATLDTHSQFDPLTTSRQFKVLMTDVVELMILPELMASLESKAPSLRVAVIQHSRDHYREALETGAADIALGQLPEAHVDFYQQQLFEEHFACVMRNDHPVANKFDLKEYLQARHLAIESPAVSEKLIKRGLGSRASERHIAVRIPHYLVAPFLLAKTDLIAVLPRPIIRAFSALGNLTERPLPFESLPVEFRQFWHRRTHLDPGCIWLRRQIAEHFTR